LHLRQKSAPTIFNRVAFAAFCGGFAVTFAVAFLVSRARGRRVANASVEGLDAGYSNVGFIRIPMCLLVFGPESAPASIIATLFTALRAVPVRDRRDRDRSPEGDSFWSTGAKVALAIFTSPLLIASVAGLAIGMSGLTVPSPFASFTSILGGAASPAALVCIGLFLAQERVVTDDMRSIALLVSMKLILQPAVTAFLLRIVHSNIARGVRGVYLLRSTQYQFCNCGVLLRSCTSMRDLH
jgi:malonate transporter